VPFCSYLQAWRTLRLRAQLRHQDGQWKQITTASKPKLQHGQYVFKDGAGRLQYVSQGRVREIAPASMAGDDKRKFNPQK
jgi:hypothetical protein